MGERPNQSFVTGSLKSTNLNLRMEGFLRARIQ